MKIDKPGIYPEMTSAEYFADPCPIPSLSQSIAKIVIERSPLHAWHAHPRLNPDYQHDDDTKFDVGNIAHKLMIGRGKEIIVLDEFDDWRTKAAKEAREAAAQLGKIAVLGKKFALADRMVRAAREQLEMREIAPFAPDGLGEVCTAWQEGGIWFRQLIDWLSPDFRIFCDYKTTDMSVAPHCLGRMMVNAGWPIQAAMGERGLAAVDPLGHRRRFLFVVQETEPPYCLNVVEMSEAAMSMGHRQLAHAVDIWAECIKTNRWPGYPAEIVTPEYPGWAEQQWLDREIHEAARDRLPPENLIMAG